MKLQMGPKPQLTEETTQSSFQAQTRNFLELHRLLTHVGPDKELPGQDSTTKTQGEIWQWSTPIDKGCFAVPFAR